MICIFLVLYFLVLLLSEKRSFRILGNFALYSLLAAGMAAILLIPEVCAILETDFGDMDFPSKLQSYFSVLDVLARHCLCVTTERGLEHWPNIYSGAAVFMLLPMYALNQKIPIRRRFGNLALAGFMLVSFSTNMLDFIWHGMNYPDSLPGRQSFLYIMLVLVMCYEAFRNIDTVEEKHILYGYLAAVVFLLCCEKFIDSDDFDIGIEFATLLFVTIYAILLYLYSTRKNKVWQQWLAMAAFVTVVAETGINTYNTSVGTTSRTQYLGQQEDYKTLAEFARQREEERLSSVSGNTSFFRFEKFIRKTKNDGTLTGYPTASVFSSTLNSYVMDLYKRWGMRHSKVYYGFDGATAFTSALLNVKYMFGEDDSFESSLYKEVGHSGDIYLYECTQTLPFGYVAPLEYDLPEGYSGQGLKLQNRMVNDLGVDGQLFKQTKCEQAGDDVRLTANQDGHFYMHVTASGTSKIEASGSFGTRNYNDLKNGSVLYLGFLNEGDTVTLENGDSKDETPEISLDAYVMNESVLREVLDILSENAMTGVTFDSTHVNGEITLEKEGRLILSIPHEDGWTVLMDGEKVQPQLFGGTLMAFDLPAGSYTISMSYVPEGKYAGIAVSVVSIGIFVGILFIKRRAGKKAADREYLQKEEALEEKKQIREGEELPAEQNTLTEEGKLADVGEASKGKESLKVEESL